MLVQLYIKAYCIVYYTPSVHTSTLRARPQATKRPNRPSRDHAGRATVPSYENRSKPR